MSSQDIDILRRAAEILKRYPLCPSCLGRLFSNYLRGFSNYERGVSLLMTLLMELQERLQLSDGAAAAELGRIKRAFPEPFRQSLEGLGVKWEGPAECYICRGFMSALDDLAASAAEVLRSLKADSFVVGVSGDEELLAREDEVWRSFSISGAESIRNEIKRELGKRVQKMTGVPVDFSSPGVMIIVDVRNGRVGYVSNPLLVKGAYLKLGRNISQSIWVTSRKKVVPFSVEEAANACSDYLEGSRVVIHAAGREDVDVRMLGSGRPLVLEIKSPRRRNLSANSLEHCLNRRNVWVKFILEGRVDREAARRLKVSDKLHRKIYRALIYCEQGLSNDDLLALEREFRDAAISQRTPTRVLRRRADITRKKRVFWVRARMVGGGWAEVYVATEGGLYVKELITGDGGRTNPSFSSVLGKPVTCAELDVIQILDGYQHA